MSSTSTVTAHVGGGRILPTDLFIGGRFMPAESGARFAVVDPATESEIASVANADVVDGLRALEAARAAADGWAATAPRARAEILRRAFEIMTEREDELARLISLENGKALPDALSEVRYAADFFRWYSEEAVRLVGDISRAPSGANDIVVRYRPAGVALLVTPWNFPAAMATRKIAPALAAGCTAILKPSEETPLTALMIADVLSAAGVPAGAMNVVTTTNAPEVVSALIDHPEVRVLSFTGSTEVGRTLLRQASGSVTRSAMELGGNAPFIVLADADVPEAVEGAVVAKLRNGGQACTAANRFYVHRSVYDDFAHRLTARFAESRLGPGTDPGTSIGPLVNRASVEKVDRLVRDAVARGARVLIGGHPEPGTGYFYPPTVLVDVAPGSEILTEEIFGPVAPLVRFDEEDEAVALANDTEYGLVSYVFGADRGHAFSVSARLDSGMVGVNRGLVSDPAAPFGGSKQSGIGREGAHDGILEYVESQYTAIDW